ncbi:family 43 glycosylhydrolase [Dysgonomonas macrotermitis]|uniref:Beta-xylosidase n=1 Tax=Dysgonomonas macrotermitis TaxID=1346286 RepID=A0A1M4W2X9_9BACT|nr:family 43 glycosylhydrolase [Dysgonomonas macrotermitis]SHE75547.1 Beta-xylosidase [Dysgonomonas macrotermitis]
MNKCFLMILCLMAFIPGVHSADGGYPKVILKGDYADPTILRDGNDFYMTHSAFVYAPGFLIWHSTDLVNWQPLTRTMTAITGSAYAPDLIKHGDKYYIYYPSNGTNYVIWADNITGPWSSPIDLKTGLIDPGHVVGEEGKRYLHLSKGMMVELTDNGLAIAGEPFKTYEGWQYPRDWEVECFCLESPKLTYKDGWYYMTSAEGGTAGPATSHMVVSARSRSAKGPWENSPYNPIIHTYSADEQWWSKGHGTLVDDAQGNWWIVYHAYEKDSHTLGRQTLIDPIKWTEDGWFLLDKDRASLKSDPYFSGMELSDDFSSDKPGIQWTTWGRYDEQNFLLENNSLYMKGKGTTPRNGRLLLITAPYKNYQIQTEVTVEENNSGGLVLFYRDNVFAGITSDGTHFTIYKSADEKEEVVNKFGKHFFVKIINQQDICTIQVSGDGREWETVSENLDVSGMHHNNHRGFFALRPGIVATGEQTVRFHDFKYTAGVLAPKPAFRDPVYDGAADPVVIWNPFFKKWWMYYTNRRATETHLPGVSWVFKTPIGIAESTDGANWTYAGTANFPELPEEAGGENATLWAPDVVAGNDGKWHMYLSIQPGVAERWGVVPGYIAHLVSGDMRDWQYVRKFDLPAGSYDADVIRMPDSTWRMYYKDPTGGASTFYYMTSENLYDWSEPVRVLSQKGEGPIVFNWKDYYWMILCDGLGFTTLRSADAEKWELQPGGKLMPDGTGTGIDDIPAALHGEIVISDNRAYLYYFTHPGRVGEDKNKDGFDQRRSSIQVVELMFKDGWISADRNQPTFVQLNNPKE